MPPRTDPVRNAANELQRERSRLEAELKRIDGALAALGTVDRRKKAGSRKASRPRKMSRAGRKAISRAAKKRWAKYRAEQKKGE